VTGSDGRSGDLTTGSGTDGRVASRGDVCGRERDPQPDREIGGRHRGDIAPVERLIADLGGRGRHVALKLLTR
jgi:hypothetical protein